jgi:hypothetical protein
VMDTGRFVKIAYPLECLVFLDVTNI